MLPRAWRARLVAQNLRYLSSQSQPQQQSLQHGAVYLDSILPIQLNRFDFRHLLFSSRKNGLVRSIKERFKPISIHNFEIDQLVPHPKDGGVIVKFRYNSDDPQNAVQEIETEIKKKVSEGGGIPSWRGKSSSGVWLVRGSPWVEDLYRYPSNMVKVSFEGPDISEEALYKLFRPFGRIAQITEPTPVPAGTLRSSTVFFERIHSSAIACNVLHGLEYQTTPSSTTKLRCVYLTPIQAHAIRDWIAKHPRIVLPVLLFLLCSITYTVFDPIRPWMVEGKMLDWFSLQGYINA